MSRDLMDQFFGPGTMSEGDRTLNEHRERRAKAINKGREIVIGHSFGRVFLDPKTKQPITIVLPPMQPISQTDHATRTRFASSHIS